jgi:hypothetical protein
MGEQNRADQALRRPPSRDGRHAMKRGANPDTSRDAASSLSSNGVSSIVPGSGADGMMLSAARIKAQAVGAASRGDWLSSADYKFAERIDHSRHGAAGVALRPTCGLAHIYPAWPGARRRVRQTRSGTAAAAMLCMRMSLSAAARHVR